jgi:histidinol-phosphate aminotransferase
MLPLSHSVIQAADVAGSDATVSMTEIEPRSVIKKLQSERPPSEDRSGKVRLDMNENTAGAPAVVAQRLRAINRKELGTYPDYEAARVELARYFRVSPDELLLTNGVDDAIKLICDTFVDPGDTLLVPALTFPMYQFVHSVAGGKIVVVSHDENLRLPLDPVLAALRRTPKSKIRWVALANPNNPTGTIIPEADLKAILQAAPTTLVVVDEAYFDYSDATVLPWIRRYPNLVVTRTFSKAYGLAALRLGLIFAGRELTGWMRRAQAVFPVNSLALIAAMESTRNPEAVRRHIEGVRRNRVVLCQCLDSLGVAYAPSAANFVFACFGKHASKIARELGEQGILVRHWSGDSRLESYFRIGIGTSSETRRLIRALQSLRHLIELDHPESAWRGAREYSPLRS